jgi:hypothetical protein
MKEYKSKLKGAKLSLYKNPPKHLEKGKLSQSKWPRLTTGKLKRLKK